MKHLIALSVLIVMQLYTSGASAQHACIFASVIANDSGQFMGASSLGSGLYRSDDTGRTWRHIGWDNLKTYAVDASPNTNCQELFVASGLCVLRSLDGGEHWKVMTDGDVAEVLDIAIDPTNANTLYIATAHGPWRSTNRGYTWKKLLRGLPMPYSSKVCFDRSSREGLLLKNGGGLFAITESDTVWHAATPLSHSEIRNGVVYEGNYPDAHARIRVGTMSTLGWLGNGVMTIESSGLSQVPLRSALAGCQVWSLRVFEVR